MPRTLSYERSRPRVGGTLTAGSQWSQDHIRRQPRVTPSIDAAPGSLTIGAHNIRNTGYLEDNVRVTSRSLSSVAAGSGALLLMVAAVVVASAGPADAAPQLVCRKVVAETATGEGRNAALGSRVKCARGEMLTGGTCYAETRPEADGTCQTSATGIIQQIVDHPGTTEEAFFTCMQTGGTDCPVQARTRAMAICCKIEETAAPAAK
jgi:hypothetical protein